MANDDHSIPPEGSPQMDWAGGVFTRRSLLKAVGAGGALTSLSVLAPDVASAAGLLPAGRFGGLRTDTLTVEHLADPLGIDVPAPLLSWKLAATGWAAAQSAYRIQVSKGSGSHTVWDTGRVRSAQSFDVAYAGRPLASRTKYSWRVMVWDVLGRSSAWSTPATFETSFLEPADFGGDWIGSPHRPAVTPLTGSDWIWYPEGAPANSAPAGTRYFRKDVVIPAGSVISSAQLQMTADDEYELFVNGTSVLQSPAGQNTWSTAQVTDISAFLTAGSNVLAAVATNAAAGAAGLLGQLHVVTASGAEIDVSTDASWLAANTEQTGWQSPTFDDSGWPAATVAAPYGSAPWYTNVTTQPPPEALLRQTFKVSKRIASARASISGLGYYKLYLNGQRIGDHELDPGFTVYNKTILYATYDVTKALRSGENAVGVSLGRGYFAELQPDEWVSAPWHDEPKLKFELDITYSDGTTNTVISATNWLTADGPTVAQSVWLGETYDARLEQPGWNAPGFDDSSWRPAVSATAPGGRLRSQLFPAIKVTDTLHETAVTQHAPGVTIHDFGTTTAGWANIQVQGPRGATVGIVYGEKLKADGTVDNDDVFFTIQSYSYTLKGVGIESYEPSYSYAGFRYVQVTLPDGVTLEAITGKRVHTAVETTGGFTSSSTLLSAYQSAQANTILNNLASVPTDTPMYEKRPYTADGFLYADSAIANFDMENFYESWMRTHRDDQSPDGTFANTVPGTAGGKANPDPVWSSSYLLINWDLYWYYGNTRTLADNYAGLTRWMDYYEQNIAGTGGIYTGFSYGDWLSPAGANAPEGTRLTATAYLYKGATTLSKIADALGHTRDAARYSRLAATIATTFHTTFYSATSGAYFDDPAAGYRQTSNLLPLSFGMVPSAVRGRVFANLVEDVTARGNHLNTGAMGTKELLRVLTENGHAELAYSVATNPTFPGWGYWFQALGATTMWEEWDAQSRSHDHAFLGTVVDWLYQFVAGIQPAAPGYRKITIRPYPSTTLTSAEAHVDSPFGQIRSGWTRDAKHFTLHVTVPVGASADVYVPVLANQRISVAAGVATPGTSSGGSALAAPDGGSGGYAHYRVGSGSYTFTARSG